MNRFYSFLFCWICYNKYKKFCVLKNFDLGTGFHEIWHKKIQMAAILKFGKVKKYFFFTNVTYFSVNTFAKFRKNISLGF